MIKTIPPVLAAALMLAGCASAPTPEAAAVPQKAERPLLCLTSAGSAHPALDIAVRRAFADRGYPVRWVDDAREISSRTCRYVFSLSVGPARNPSELPDFISLEYRDAYTGESNRVSWKKMSVGSFMRVTAGAADAGNNAFLTGFYDDPDRIVRGLVDRILPAYGSRLDGIR